MRQPRAKRRGFTVVELMIVVSIIGLLIVLAVPSMLRTRMRSQDTAFINDLRTLSDSTLEVYAVQHGDYPPEAAEGVEPAGLGEYLPRHFVWAAPTEIGGLWDWDRAADRASTVFGCYAGLSIYAPNRTSAQMMDIDARIDDGDLDNGRFRRRENGYIYVLQ